MILEYLQSVTNYAFQSIGFGCKQLSGASEVLCTVKIKQIDHIGRYLIATS